MRLPAIPHPVALALSLALTAPLVQAQPVSDAAGDTGLVDETPRLWFVELSGAPLADGGSRSGLTQEKQAFRKAASAAKLALRERFAYDNLWNGFSVETGAENLAALSRLPGVRNVYPVASFSLDGELSEPDLVTAISMTGADIAQNSLGLSGQGVKVAVMDTGIDYHNPALGGCFGAGCRVATGWDFVGDSFNADASSPAYNPVPTPDADPDDCGGHGSHVAGIIGADGAIRGVAPKVSFGAYRVFGCQGSTTADIMVAAMERAQADGMQVLNMSIGSSLQWPEYPTAQAATRLVNKGVVVVASAGNSSDLGLFASGAPSVGQKVIGVASVDNSHVQLAQFRISPDGQVIGYGNATGAPAAPTSGTDPMTRTGTVSSTADACTSLPAGSLSGKAVLIRRGTCSFYVKARNAELAGAKAVVLYNNAPGRVSPTVAGTPAIGIPVVAIADSEGALINSRLATGPVDLTWTADKGRFANATGGLLSSFSSYGLATDLSLKPDIAAPGGQIYSTYPLEKGGFATLSGTSMASPHVAGAAALLLQAKPNTPSQAVRGIFQNSADPLPWSGNPGLGFLDLVHRQGAGMIDVDDAILAKTRIEPGKLSLGDADSSGALRQLTISNEGDNDVTYLLSHSPALASGANQFTPSVLLQNAGVSFSVPAVTVAAGGQATVEVAVTEPAGLAAHGVYGGYVVLTEQDSGKAWRVPYAGMKGDYQAVTVLKPTPSGFPWLARLAGGSYAKAAAESSFSMSGSDLPFLLAHFDYPVRRMTVTVRNADTGQSWHRAYNEEYLARNSSATSFRAYPFDGTTVAGKKTYTVPNGRYVLELSVLKAGGDENNPAHVETWTSPAFLIAR